MARAVEIVLIASVDEWLAQASDRYVWFTKAELDYAFSKSDPARRLAARLAAKRAATRLFGPAPRLCEIEVLPARGGPPRLALLSRDHARQLEERGQRLMLSLTHGLTHAAALVLLVSGAA